MVDALGPPHPANRHDSGSRGAGTDRRLDKVTSGLSDHLWTIIVLIKRAAE